jgi:hypothetical protein
MQRIRTTYPQVEEQPFYDNIGRHVFTRFVIRPANAELHGSRFTSSPV